MQLALYPECDAVLIKCLVDAWIILYIRMVADARNRNSLTLLILIQGDGTALAAYVSR